MGKRDLEALQRFVSELVRRVSPIDGEERLGRRVDDLVSPSARGMRPAERLDVYREQFWLRHLPNLQSDYPTLSWVLGGEAAFRELCTQYLCACPPRTWDLQRLGVDLPAYVASHSPWGDDLLARDAARLDWAFMEAFDAPDAPPFDPRALASAPEDAWPHARIVFHPSVRPLAVAHPVHELREAVTRGEARERSPAAETRVVVWRSPTCSLRSVAIEPIAFELLVALQGDVVLGEACEAIARASGEVEPEALGPRLAEWFQQWTASDWVSSVRFGN